VNAIAAKVESTGERFAESKDKLRRTRLELLLMFMKADERQRERLIAEVPDIVPLIEEAASLEEAASRDEASIQEELDRLDQRELERVRGEQPSLPFFGDPPEVPAGAGDRGVLLVAMLIRFSTTPPLAPAELASAEQIESWLAPNRERIWLTSLLSRHREHAGSLVAAAATQRFRFSTDPGASSGEPDGPLFLQNLFGLRLRAFSP
jgi:hypothetical protein